MALNFGEVTYASN